jgi:uncharacterized protein (UPF0332 family)
MVDSKKIKDELASLIANGTLVFYASQWHENRNAHNKETQEYIKKVAEKMGDFKKEYHTWYAKAQRVVSTLAPERLEEFNAYYTGNKSVKAVKDFSYLTAGITHYLQGIITTGYGEEKNYFGKFTSGLQQQMNILGAMSANLEDVLFNLQSEIQYGIFKSELDVAKELKKHKQFRPSGAVAGVVIEGHLKAVLAKRDITSKKKNPCMSDYNDELKEHKVIDIAMWRLIQRCGDIRNYCVHPKEREPTVDEVEDIIRAAEKILSEVA